MRSQGWSPRDMISALTGDKGTRTLYYMKINQDVCLQTRKRVLTRHWAFGTFILDFLTSQVMWNLFKPLVCGCLLQQPKQILSYSPGPSQVSRSLPKETFFLTCALYDGTDSWGVGIEKVGLVNLAVLSIIWMFICNIRDSSWWGSLGAKLPGLERSKRFSSGATGLLFS